MGLGAPDDAAVWKLDDERALVVTTDFFTPVVDTPYEYGAIAAANSLSDVYAMGGTPFLALNIAALPPDLPGKSAVKSCAVALKNAAKPGWWSPAGIRFRIRNQNSAWWLVGFVPPEEDALQKRREAGRPACADQAAWIWGNDDRLETGKSCTRLM